MQNKKVKHRPSTKYLYFFIQLQARPVLFWRKNRKIKKSFSYLPIFFQHVSETQLFFFFFFTPYEDICCGYLFELHRPVNAIQMNIINICLYKENQKKHKTSHKHHLMLLTAKGPFCVVHIRWRLHGTTQEGFFKDNFYFSYPKNIFCRYLSQSPQ